MQVKRGQISKGLLTGRKTQWNTADRNCLGVPVLAFTDYDKHIATGSRVVGRVGSKSQSGFPCRHSPMQQTIAANRTTDVPILGPEAHTNLN